MVDHTEASALGAPDEPGHPKAMAMVVNGRPKMVTARELSFVQVVALAFDAPSSGGNTLYTVTYRRGDGHKPEGTLVEGETVKLKDGMIFNVTATDKS